MNGISADRCQRRNPKNESAPIRQNSAPSGANTARNPSNESTVKFGFPEGFGSSACETSNPGSPAMASSVIASRSSKLAVDPCGFRG